MFGQTLFARLATERFDRLTFKSIGKPILLQYSDPGSSNMIRRLSLPVMTRPW